MTLSIDRFEEFFEALYGYEPFPWQKRLARQVFASGWPACIDLPTASGKTACIDIAVFVLACQADRSANERTVGRRIFFSVNRRVIVDEAYERSRAIAQRLLEMERGDAPGILGDVARALRSLNAQQNRSLAPPIDVAQLRGGIYRDAAWARSLTQPTIVCTTADQLGSRLLFRGYGVSNSMRPVHAALCGCDSTILLDEAHVTRAFCQTMQLLPRYQAQHRTVSPLTFVQMTATPVGDIAERFSLNVDDLADETLKNRQLAGKPALLAECKKKSLVTDIAKHALEAEKTGDQAVGIIVNRVQTARAVAHRIEQEKPEGAEVHLIIGRMRPIDRDDLQSKLHGLVGPARHDVLDHPIFIVATQCLEVGADYDFDALITECASIDALRQRFGRLNRKGRDINATATILADHESLKGDDPIYGDAIKHTWNWLQSSKNGDGRVDFGIAAFKSLWDAVPEVERAAMLVPAPDAAVLLPAHLDVLAQTNPEPVPSPDVSYFIHGPCRDMAEVNVCWRADLGNDASQWPEVVRLLPPTSPECMTVPLRDVRRWMRASNDDAPQADVPIADTDDVNRSAPPSAESRNARRVLIWRGTNDASSTDNASDLRPGDTIALPIHAGGWDAFGQIPGVPVFSEFERLAKSTDEADVKRVRDIERRLDVAEQATRQTRRRVVVRLHPSFPGRAELRGLPARELPATLRVALEDELADDHDERERVLEVLRSRSFDCHHYGEPARDSGALAQDEVIIFKRPLEAPSALEFPPPEEDDNADDNLSRLAAREKPVPLDEHTEHVVEQIDADLTHLGLAAAETLRQAARLHDTGKADVRFQALLGGLTPHEAMERPLLIAKSPVRTLTQAEKFALRERSLLPRGFRHEALSMQIIESQWDALDMPASVDRDMLLHLIAAHHGYARPFAPVCEDTLSDFELLSLSVNGFSVSPDVRRSWIPAHRLDSGVCERFWKLSRKHGWWALAYLETILRLADQQASALEQKESSK